MVLLWESSLYSLQEPSSLEKVWQIKMSLDHNTQSHNDDKEPAIETSLQGQQNQGGKVGGGVNNSPPPREQSR